ncbi:MAG: glycosyltransferase family 4 protein [Flectobacillus sp.]|nr:glycosyltransferase family 4 protein [Flectobacillus sp.]
MKIVIPVTGFGKSGGYRVLSQLANYWIRKGHQVTFISHVKSMAVYFPTDAEIIWVDNAGNKCDFEDHEKFANKTGLKQFLNTLNSLRIALNKYCEGYDVILANHSFTAYSVLFSKISGRKYYYIQAYEPEYYRLLGGLKNNAFSLMAYFTYYLPLIKIVNSPLYFNYKNILSEEYVYPGIDLSVFRNKGRHLNHSPLRLGVIGRSEVYKGTKYVYDAFEKLRKEIDVELWVAFGDTDKYDKNIKYMNPNSDIELSNFYQEIDILIAAGTVQIGAVHYPVIEAMACGTPVINTGYYPSNNNNSWIVPIHNSDKIVEAVKFLLSDENITKRKNLALDNIQEFEWEVVSEKMIQIFLKNKS